MKTPASDRRGKARARRDPPWITTRRPQIILGYKLHIAACSILADPNGTRTKGVLSFSYISSVSFTQIHLIASIFLCAPNLAEFDNGGQGVALISDDDVDTGPPRDLHCLTAHPVSWSATRHHPSFVAPARPLPSLRPVCELPEVVMSGSSAAVPSVGDGPSHNGTLELPFNVGVCPGVYCAWCHPPFVPAAHVSCKSEH